MPIPKNPIFTSSQLYYHFFYFTMCRIDSGSKNCPYVKKNHCIPNLWVPLFCTAKFPKVWILPVLLFTSPWRDLTLPYLFSVNLETDLEAWSNKSSMSLSQNNFIGSGAYTYKGSMSCLRVSVFYYCLDP